MTIESGMIEPGMIFIGTLIFNAGGFVYLANSWKKSINGHFEKIDTAIATIAGEVGKLREQQEGQSRFCEAVQNGKRGSKP